MPIELPAKLDSLDDLAPNLKPLYVPAENGGGFVFKDITGMQNAFVQTKEKLQTTTAQLTQLQATLQGFGDMKPDEVKALIATKAEIEAAKNNLPSEIQNIKTQLTQAYEGQVQSAKKEAGTLRSLIEDSTRGDAVKSALLAAGARSDRIEQLAALVSPKISVAWDPTTNKPRAAVLKPDGTPVLNPETANEMTPLDIVAGFKKDLPEWFQATAGNGGGAAGGAVVAPTDGDPLKWTMDQQRAYAKVHGESALQELIINAAKKKQAA